VRTVVVPLTSALAHRSDGDPLNFVELDLITAPIVEGIADDFGVFDSPDSFYARHGSNLSGLKRWLYERLIRHAMNRNVARVRASRW